MPPLCTAVFQYIFNRRAVEVIEEHDKTQPLFLFLSYQSVHSPIEVGVCVCVCVRVRVRVRVEALACIHIKKTKQNPQTSF